MDTEIGHSYWDHSYNPTMLLCLAIIIALFASLRFFSGAISHVDASYELSQKDNGAFGISLAGVVFGVTLVLSGVIPNSWTMDLFEVGIAVAVYGIVGIALMVLTRVIFDRIALPRISMRDEIVKGNSAAAIIDAGNVIAAALVVRAVMVWTPTDTTSIASVVDLLKLYAVSQVLLTVIAMVHVRLFTMHGVDDRTLQDEIHGGNTALALRLSGRRIGIAFAITAASNIMVYELFSVNSLLLEWVMVSLLFVIGLTILSWLATRFILFGMDVNDEVINQRNIALGAVQGTVYIALGMLVTSLVGG
ncbi:MAG: DUF350 domain-containing protein [Alphaproteobacteria bacterium]|nr:DUF350 domain-containing protein [Alphaproteobacteria bacterium]